MLKHLQQIKVGDKVVVTCRGVDDDPNGMGEGKPWTNAWVEEMDIAIGKTVTVKVIDPEMGVLFAEDKDVFNYAYPMNVLELVEEEIAA